ncbi:ComF family protein [Neptunitalea lumnitzerae]|uniref:Amidophosphoribosyltransferase n=1 Tax=Neptunitalea lumnitzerae TaxID=2965509 RepID=A0ABQ5MMY1_9FLAO|nr:ComF family protein [Neptunitalea sp. Y10]GLB50753.1 amidophosphoribosyltransferase [Neptunitalea sp. Y10]
MLQAIKNITNIFFPKTCPGCNNYLDLSQHTLCLDCRHTLGITNFHEDTENILARTLYGKCSIENATAMFIFKKESTVQHLIHNLKYKGQQQVGTVLGAWYGDLLKDVHRFKNIDAIVPVPLHPRRKRQRGYNQVTTFAKELSFALKIPLEEDILIRTRYTKTQTFKNRLLRQYKKEVFDVHPNNFRTPKHILLVDDVITTGATIISCVKVLQKIPNVKVSVAAIAFTE